MSTQTLNEGERFALWIDALKCKPSNEGLITYQANTCELFDWDFRVHQHHYCGSAWQLKDCKKCVLKCIEIHEFLGFGRRWDNCELQSSGPLVACSLITNDASVQCIYQGGVSFQLNPHYYRNLRLRRWIAPIYSEQGWFGILVYTRRFLFQKRWTLFAFAKEAMKVQLNPETLFGHPALTEEGEPRRVIGTLLSAG